MHKGLLIVLVTIAIAGCEKLPQQSSGSNSTASTTSAPPPPQEPDANAEFIETVSGVWSDNAGTVVTLDYRDREFFLILGDDPKYVRLGDVDLVNETVNLVVKRASDGKDLIWTLRKIWNADKTSYNLELTLDDGTRQPLSFIRRISSQDLDRIANLYATPAAAPLDTAALQIPAAPMEANEVVPPSFDCKAVRTMTEGLICENPALARSDADMALMYNQLVTTAIGDDVREEQRYWLKFIRDKCTSLQCLTQAYDTRIEQLRGRAGASLPSPVDDRLAVQAVTNFYQALGRGDGSAAADIVIAEKRNGGPLSAPELSKFREGVVGPLTLTSVDNSGPNQVTAHYQYQYQNGRSCNGYSVITLSNRGAAQIEKIDAPSGC